MLSENDMEANLMLSKDEWRADFLTQHNHPLDSLDEITEISLTLNIIKTWRACSCPRDFRLYDLYEILKYLRR